MPGWRVTEPGCRGEARAGRAASCRSGREPERNGDGFGELLALLEPKPSVVWGTWETGAGARVSGSLRVNVINCLRARTQGPEGSQLVPRRRALDLRSVSLGEGRRAAGPPAFWLLVALGGPGQAQLLGLRDVQPGRVLLWGAEGSAGPRRPVPLAPPRRPHRPGSRSRP